MVPYEDNSNVLAGMVKGTSKGEQLDAGAASIHLMLACLRARPWWEYVQSESDWSDGASRQLLNDEWTRRHGFQMGVGDIPVWPWLAQEKERLRQAQAVPV